MLQDYYPHLLEVLKYFPNVPRGPVPQKISESMRILLPWLQDQATKDAPLSPPYPAALLSEKHLVEAAIGYIGFAPRDAISDLDSLLTSHTLDSHTVSLEQLQDYVHALITGSAPLSQKLKLEPRHCIFALTPVAGPWYQGVHEADWRVDFKSEWIAKQFVDMLDGEEEARISEQISHFLGGGVAIGVAGYLFEALVHRRLVLDNQSGTTSDSWPLQAMVLEEDNGEPVFKLSRTTSVPPDVRFAKIGRSCKRIDGLPEHFESGTYYRPRTRNYPFVDSFVRHRRRVVCCTVGHSGGDFS